MAERNSANDERNAILALSCSSGDRYDRFSSILFENRHVNELELLNMKKNPIRLLIAFATAVLFASTASAVTHTFTINLTVDQASTPTGTGSGTGTATYDDVSGEFSWNFSYAGLSGAVTAAHFHGPGAPGVSAPVIVTVPMADTTPNMGMTTITPSEGADLINDLWYLNVHTSTVGSGEIRGQLINDNPPVDNTALIASLEKKIKKLKKKAKAAKKKGNSKKAKKLKKKAKKLQKTVNALS